MLVGIVRMVGDVEILVVILVGIIGMVRRAEIVIMVEGV
jgi:hypothetical protein